MIQARLSCIMVLVKSEKLHMLHPSTPAYSLELSYLTPRQKDVGEIGNGDCDPLKAEDGIPYYPCGLIANSLFNDTFNSPQLTNPRNATGNETEEYTMTNKGIAWSSDKDLYKKTKYALDQIVPPPNWRKKYPVYNSSFPPPDLHQDEAFQVWMRTAGLPTFSKLALRNDTASLKQGTYTVDIWDGRYIFIGERLLPYYPVAS